MQENDRTLLFSDGDNGRWKRFSVEMHHSTNN